jgi:hypothetical protein
MYAPIERRQIYELPMEFAKLEWLEKRLKRLNANYQLVISRRMFDVAYMEEFQFTVVRWEGTPMKNKRHLVLETTDLEQMESALFMLINTEEADAKVHRAVGN